MKMLPVCLLGPFVLAGVLQLAGWSYAPPLEAMAIFGVASMVGGLVAIVRLSRHGRYVYGLPPRPAALPPAPVRAQIEYAPARQALPARVPVQWELPMEQELDLVSRRLRKSIHRAFLLLLTKHASDWGDEIARELEVADRRITRGELVP